MRKRDEILERAADRRSFRLAAPVPIKLKRASKPLLVEGGKIPPLSASQRRKIERQIKPSGPIQQAMLDAGYVPPKPPKRKRQRSSRGDRTEVMRQGVAARWIEDRPMPDPTTERCPGSGQPAATVEGYLLTCGTCGQKLGVAPPFTSPEHNREKQP